MASSGLIGWSKVATMDIECPVKTGTRTQVQATARSGMWRILRLSLRSLRSSSVSPEPSSSRLPAIESTLWAIGPGNFLDAG